MQHVQSKEHLSHEIKHLFEAHLLPGSKRPVQARLAQLCLHEETLVLDPSLVVPNNMQDFLAAVRSAHFRQRLHLLQVTVSVCGPPETATGALDRIFHPVHPASDTVDLPETARAYDADNVKVRLETRHRRGRPMSLMEGSPPAAASWPGPAASVLVGATGVAAAAVPFGGVRGVMVGMRFVGMSVERGRRPGGRSRGIARMGGFVWSGRRESHYIRRALIQEIVFPKFILHSIATLKISVNILP